MWIGLWGTVTVRDWSLEQEIVALSSPKMGARMFSSAFFYELYAEGRQQGAAVCVDRQVEHTAAVRAATGIEPDV